MIGSEKRDHFTQLLILHIIESENDDSRFSLVCVNTHCCRGLDDPNGGGRGDL